MLLLLPLLLQRLLSWSRWCPVHVTLDSCLTDEEHPSALPPDYPSPRRDFNSGNIRLHDVVTNVHAQRASRQPQKCPSEEHHQLHEEDLVLLASAVACVARVITSVFCVLQLRKHEQVHRAHSSTDCHFHFDVSHQPTPKVRIQVTPVRWASTYSGQVGFIVDSLLGTGSHISASKKHQFSCSVVLLILVAAKRPSSKYTPLTVSSNSVATADVTNGSSAVSPTG